MTDFSFENKGLKLLHDNDELPRIPEEYHPRLCPHCGGFGGLPKGTRSNHHWIACPACQGVGLEPHSVYCPQPRCKAVKNKVYLRLSTGGYHCTNPACLYFNTPHIPPSVK